MLRSILMTGVAMLLAGAAGCAHCDTCDDFPAPCTGSGCGYGTSAPAGPAAFSPYMVEGHGGAVAGPVTTAPAPATSGAAKPAATEDDLPATNPAAKPDSPPVAPPAGGLSPFDR